MLLIATVLVWLFASVAIVAVCMAAASGDAGKTVDEENQVPGTDASTSVPLGNGRGDAPQLRAHYSLDIPSMGAAATLVRAAAPRGGSHPPGVLRPPEGPGGPT